MAFRIKFFCEILFRVLHFKLHRANFVFKSCHWMKYFVSYTTRDAEVTIDLLKAFSNELEKIGKVFIDIIDNNSKDKQSRVIAELDSSDILLLIETKNIYQSNWVSIEIERAQSKQIPIKIISLNDLKRVIDDELILQIIS